MKAQLNRFAPSATNLIRTDHSKVLTAFHRYKSNTAPETKRALVSLISTALEVHAQLEEEIFYPVVRGLDPTLVEKNVPEHDRMRQLIGSLRNMEPRNPNYDRTFMDLMRAVIHHVADEETVLLPQAEYMLQHRLGELGAKMAKRKMELMLPHAADLVSNTLRARPASGMLLGAAVVLAASALFGHSPRRNVASRY